MLSYNYNITILFFYMAYSSLYARVYDRAQKAGQSLLLVCKFAPTKFYLVIIAVWQILAWLQAINIINRLQGNFLILHYNIDFGIDLVGVPMKIFYFPAAGLLVLLLNFVLTAVFSRHQGARILFHLLFSVSILFNVFLNLALFAVYLINFR